jgi:hypothetical protein
LVDASEWLIKITILSPDPLSNFLENFLKNCMSSSVGERRKVLVGWKSDAEDGVFDLEVDEELERE